MNRIFFLLGLILVSFRAIAQLEDSFWPLGGDLQGGAGYLQFNGIASPVYDAHQYHVGGINNESSIAVCYPNGQLRFWVKMAPPNYLGSRNSIFDASGGAVPNSDLLMNPGPAQHHKPVVVPHPGNGDQYYIFYSNGNSLMYTLLDMSLNNGHGGIVPGAKHKVLSGYGTIIPLRIFAVKGCTGVWLVARSIFENAYYSFSITTYGINTTKVISPASLTGIANQYYFNYSAGQIKASPDGSKIASITEKGIELHNFEKCSGKIKPVGFIDSTSVILNSLLPNDREQIYSSVCFSPDNAKLYATYMDTTVNVIGTWPILMSSLRNRVYQFDLSSQNLSTIQASKTAILYQPMQLVKDIFSCPHHISWHLGDMKLGPDGKIYVANNLKEECPQQPSNYAAGPNFHIIHQPNLPGLACNPQLDAFTYLPGNRGYNGRSLPKDIVTAPKEIPDTIPGATHNVEVCFLKEYSIMASEDGACYLWDNGATEVMRALDSSGTYWVRYFKDCQVQTDTYHVNFIPLPEVPQLSYGCPGEGSIHIKQPKDNSTNFRYILNNADYFVNSAISNQGFTFIGLVGGNYQLQIIAGNACDTTLQLMVDEYPKPDLVVSPSDTTIFYGDSISIQASGALTYVWWPTSPLDSATRANPVARPLKSTLFTVIGLNEFGCRDTGFVNVGINYDMPEFIPSAFSPNGDGLNDVLALYGITFQKVVQFRIFNRYGQEVFSTIDPKGGWDGTFKGNKCDIGTYYYIIQLNYPDGNMRTFKGDVSLIR